MKPAAPPPWRQGLVAETRDLIAGSRTMVAWSIARLLASNRERRPAEAIPGPPGPTPADVLLELLGSPCDLDVLIFIHRHPRALLGVDDLARGAGYSVDEVRASVEALSTAGLITCAKRKERQRDSAIVFYHVTPGTWDAMLPVLLWVASSDDGRRDLRRALSRTRARVSLATRLHR